jgi:hypothetical protein
MANGLIFPYHVASVMTNGVTRKANGTQAMVVLGQARSQSWLANPPRRFDARRDASWLDRRRLRVAMPPRKTSRQDARARTENQHRWTSREY